MYAGLRLARVGRGSPGSGWGECEDGAEAGFQLGEAAFTAGCGLS